MSQEQKYILKKQKDLSDILEKSNEEIEELFSEIFQLKCNEINEKLRKCPGEPFIFAITGSYIKTISQGTFHRQTAHTPFHIIYAGHITGKELLITSQLRDYEIDSTITYEKNSFKKESGFVKIDGNPGLKNSYFRNEGLPEWSLQDIITELFDERLRILIKRRMYQKNPEISGVHLFIGNKECEPIFYENIFTDDTKHEMKKLNIFG